MVTTGAWQRRSGGEGADDIVVLECYYRCYYEAVLIRAIKNEQKNGNGLFT